MDPLPSQQHNEVTTTVFSAASDDVATVATFAGKAPVEESDSGDLSPDSGSDRKRSAAGDRAPSPTISVTVVSVTSSPPCSPAVSSSKSSIHSVSLEPAHDASSSSEQLAPPALDVESPAPIAAPLSVVEPGQAPTPPASSPSPEPFPLDSTGECDPAGGSADEEDHGLPTEQADIPASPVIVVATFTEVQPAGDPAEDPSKDLEQLPEQDTSPKGETDDEQLTEQADRQIDELAVASASEPTVEPASHPTDEPIPRPIGEPAALPDPEEPMAELDRSDDSHESIEAPGPVIEVRQSSEPPLEPGELNDPAPDLADQPMDDATETSAVLGGASAGSLTSTSVIGMGSSSASSLTLAERRSAPSISVTTAPPSSTPAGPAPTITATISNAAPLGAASSHEAIEMGAINSATAGPLSQAGGPTSATTGAPGPSMADAPARDDDRAQPLPDMPVRGTKIDEHHRNFVLMYDMLSGMRVSLSRCHAKDSRPLTSADFTEVQKMVFDITGNELLPYSKYDFKFKDYMPWVFRSLRDFFHIDPADYIMSLTGRYILSELGSPGKSGSFFYFSADYRYIIKTISKTEHLFFRKILHAYHSFVRENPDTLLSRFCGLYRVKLAHGRKIYFVVMTNIFPSDRDIHMTFDLKGSLVGRQTPTADGKQRVLKDLNFLRGGHRIYLGPEKAAAFMLQVERDSAFLASQNIMDYSLLLGIHDLALDTTNQQLLNTLQVVEPKTPICAPVHGTPTSTGPPVSKQTRKQIKRAIRQTDTRSLHESELSGLESAAKFRHKSIFCGDGSGFQSTSSDNEPCNLLYHMGIIDILTPFDGKKRFEHTFRSIRHNPLTISAVDPSLYACRFTYFMAQLTTGCQKPYTPTDPTFRALVGRNPSAWQALGHIPDLNPAPVPLPVQVPSVGRPSEALSEGGDAVPAEAAEAALSAGIQ
ncbi:hypothetical protein H696_04887 [Fonticula alba]|uniref:PIPK domain-containing protein n=1 Tax=Fonticula alba TaxID=691883 RepID=A0A058Z2W7_FONAL|nr:hypothetical protein H696_04887 [Fonticula alba]KCV68595.1 hypothetical protein H696_04887 [Fonticula alba]|eukprot:XP_009497027.1 hypothetical protein H696_04887 [Fonticula alba]